MRARVIANGTDMGVYEGRDKLQVLDAYAQDAGYEDYPDLHDQVGDEDDEVEVITVDDNTLALTQAELDQLKTASIVIAYDTETGEYVDWAIGEAVGTTDLDVDLDANPTYDVYMPETVEGNDTYTPYPYPSRCIQCGRWDVDTAEGEVCRSCSEGGE